MTRRTVAVAVIAGLVGLLVGVAIRLPDVEVRRVSVPSPVVETRTPQACVDALELASEALGLAGRVVGRTTVFMKPGGASLVEMLEFTAFMEEANQKLEDIKAPYQAAVAGCLSEA